MVKYSISIFLILFSQKLYYKKKKMVVIMDKVLIIIYFYKFEIIEINQWISPGIIYEIKQSDLSDLLDFLINFSLWAT